MYDEVWRNIPNYPDYLISSYGCVYNRRTKQEMRVSKTNHGHAKISLMSGESRHTLSVARLVAQAFVRPPNPMCDEVILLNGDLSDVSETNLAWRPRWFAWKYTRQLRTDIPVYYTNLSTEG